jgi:hypothetical protein
MDLYAKINFLKTMLHHLTPFTHGDKFVLSIIKSFETDPFTIKIRVARQSFSMRLSFIPENIFCLYQDLNPISSTATNALANRAMPPLHTEHIFL